jgi:Family of unknown function (DUF6174)
MSNASNPVPSPPGQNHAWIYFFVFIVVASVGVAGFMIWFNLSIQLTPDQLEEAQRLWKEKGPKSYNMVYTKLLNDDPKVDKFEVEVRGGEVKKVQMNGKPLQREKEDGPDPRIHHSMDRLLRDIERFMELDKKPDAKKVYVTAIFDDKNGALRRYIRRVMGTTQRIEMHITVEAVEK